MLTDETFAVLDFETTGLSPSMGHRPCEIAAARYRFDGNELHEQEVLERLVDPQRPIDEEALETHGITRSEASEHPPFQAIAAEVREFLADTIMVAHNASFDLYFLKSEFDIAQLDMPDVHNTIDTLELARRQFCFMHNSLDVVAAELHLDNRPEHRSLSDVRATGDFLGHAMNHLEVETVKGLIERQGGFVSVPSDPDLRLPDTIQQALDERQPIQLTYTKSGGEPTTRPITPLRAVQCGDRHYLISYCHKRQAVRSFRFDRFEKVPEAIEAKNQKREYTIQ